MTDDGNKKRSSVAVAAWLAPVFLSCWLLAAHFLHGGEALFAGLLLFLPLVTLLAANRWVVWMFRILLALGAVEWVATWWMLRGKYAAMGKDGGRMTVIILGVAVFTAVSMLVFESRALRRYFGRDKKGK